jgi:hypothetical protein
MGEEERGFSGGGGLRWKGDEELQGPGGSGDVGAGYTGWKGCAWWWIGGGCAPLEGEGTEWHCD